MTPLVAIGNEYLWGQFQVIKSFHLILASLFDITCSMLSVIMMAVFSSKWYNALSYYLGYFCNGMWNHLIDTEMPILFATINMWSLFSFTKSLLPTFLVCGVKNLRISFRFNRYFSFLVCCICLIMTQQFISCFQVQFQLHSICTINCFQNYGILLRHRVLSLSSPTLKEMAPSHRLPDSWNVRSYAQLQALVVIQNMVNNLCSRVKIWALPWLRIVYSWIILSTWHTKVEGQVRVRHGLKHRNMLSCKDTLDNLAM